MGQGSAGTFLNEAQIAAIVEQGLGSLPLGGKRVLLLVPDSTRTMPLALFFRLINAHLRGQARTVDWLVALGTHPPLDEAALHRLFGLSAGEQAATGVDVHLFNHAWNDPQALVTLGTFPADEIAWLSEGRLCLEVPVRVNRMVLDYDHLLVCGPVFPHEVVGFSGGNKYFFPGIAGPDIIDFTHWLGALLTSYAIIGTMDTPVRQAIDRATTLIPRPRHALCSVVTHEGVAGLFFGAPEEAFRAAAELSAQVHVRYVSRPYRQVLSILPEMYDEIWVGAKGMYKLEPVVADGGEVILYAPHIRELSRTHGGIIRQVGYHVRDYYVKQWEAFCHYPWGVLAHSTHLRGMGTYENGVEQPRIQVTLATGIPEEVCRQVNLGYRDPASINPQAWLERQEEDLLVVPQAGEELYRLRK
ncbi:MAG: DUF2088 domain-containing protein [Chloroflexi bacterium]|nr:DUF2088 domain-containing protein [Chloroflexota bacterium]